MKGTLILLLTCAAISFVSCSRSSNPVSAKQLSQESSNVMIALSMQNAPSDIASVVGVLTRESYDTLTKEFTIVGDSAQCDFNNVAAGTWHLQVNAYDNQDSLRYSGGTSVQVVGGQVTPVSLVLNPVTGAISVTVTWGGGPAGNALSLDGQREYMEVPNSPSLSSPDTAITMEAWVKPAEQYYNTVIAKGSYDYLLDFAEGLYPGIILHGTTLDTATPDYWGRMMVGRSIPANQWTHVAVTYSESTGIKVYYGSQLVFEGPGSGRIEAGNLPLRIGARVDSLYTEYFKGEIDGVRIWNVVRTQSEIAQDMSREISGDEPGLVAYYKFDEPIGSVVIHDSSPYHNDGELYGGASLVRSSAF